MILAQDDDIQFLINIYFAAQSTRRYVDFTLLLSFRGNDIPRRAADHFGFMQPEEKRTYRTGGKVKVV